MEPKVFYGAPKTHSSGSTPRIPGYGSGSEADTDVDHPPKTQKSLHRRMESVDVRAVAAHERKRPKATPRPSRDVHGRQPLQRACARGLTARVKELLADGAEPNDRDYAGTTALHGAALHGDPEIVALLIDSGAIVDVRSGPDELDTPLMDATSAGNIAAVKVLLERGSDPRVHNLVGKTPIDFIDDELPSAKELAELLSRASNGARKRGPAIVSPSDAPAGTFPANVSGSTVTDAATMENPTRRADLLWLDVTTRKGRREVCQRAGQGDTEYIGMALEQGWHPSSEALVQAAKFGHTDVVGLLLAFGINPDGEYEGATALHAAVGRGHLDVAKLLVEGGASLDWKDANGRGYRDLVRDLPSDDDVRAYVEGREVKSAPKESFKGKVSSNVLTEAADVDVVSARVKANEDSNVAEKDKKAGTGGKASAVAKVDAKLPQDEAPGQRETLVNPEAPPENTASAEASPDEDTRKVRFQESAELAAKRERDRRAREAQMLAALEKQERKAAERRLSGATEVQAQPETQEPQVQDRDKSPSEPQVSYDSVRSLPLALRRLAATGESQPVLPLLVQRRPDGLYALDVQVALALGRARLHAELPNLRKSPVTEVGALSGLAVPWMAPNASDPKAERRKFEGMRLFWVALEDIDEAGDLPTVEIALQLPAVEIPQDELPPVSMRSAVLIAANKDALRW